MLLVTGTSDECDGFCFLAETDNRAEAFYLLLDRWNSTGDDTKRLVEWQEPDGHGCGLVLADIGITDEDIVERMVYGETGWGVFILDAVPVEVGKITLNAL